MITDGNIEPGLYRVTLDDDSVIDYQFTGTIRKEGRDHFIIDPGTLSDGETVQETQLAVSRVKVLTTLAGDVWLVLGSKLDESVQAEPAQIVSMAFDYLSYAGFVSPGIFIHTSDQIAGLYAVLKLSATGPSLELPSPDGTAEVTVESTESPENAPSPLGTGTPPPEPESPKDPAPEESDPGLNLPLESLSLESPPSPEGSPDPETPSQSAGESGPSERATATETLVVTPHEEVVVNVEDAP